MQLIKIGELAEKELLPGGRVRLIHTESMTLAYWTFDPDTPLPSHSHPHEQVVNVLEGVLELTVDGEMQRLEPGSAMVVPPDVVHSAYAVTACRVLDVFHPVREDLRALDSG